MANKKNAAPLYNWGDGKGKIHTIPKNIHAQNVEAQRYGIDLNAPASNPLTNRGAYGLAQQQAGLQYDPQIQAANQSGVNAKSWFQDYVTQVQNAQAAAQAYAAPILAQAQQAAGQPATAAPGLDPNSQAAQQSQQAAASGQDLAQLGATTLAAIPVAANNYMAGLQTTAAGQVPVAQQYYSQQAAQLQGAKGQAVASNYATNRANEANSAIAYGTLGLNQNKAAADVDLSRGVDPVTGKKLPDPKAQDRADKAAEPNKYGIPAGQWAGWSSSHRQRVIDKYNSGGKTDDTEKQEKEAAKKKAAINKATGKLRNSVTDVIDYQQTLVGQQGEDRSQKPDINGNYPTRKITQADIDRAKISKYGTLARIAIAVRDHKPLTKAQQDYLHQQDPNFRIPREWLRVPDNAAGGRDDPKPTSGQQGGIGGK